MRYFYTLLVLVCLIGCSDEIEVQYDDLPGTPLVYADGHIIYGIISGGVSGDSMFVEDGFRDFMTNGYFAGGDWRVRIIESTNEIDPSATFCVVGYDSTLGGFTTTPTGKNYTIGDHIVLSKYTDLPGVPDTIRIIDWETDTNVVVGGILRETACYPALDTIEWDVMPNTTPHKVFTVTHRVETNIPMDSLIVHADTSYTDSAGVLIHAIKCDVATTTFSTGNEVTDEDVENAEWNENAAYDSTYYGFYPGAYRPAVYDDSRERTLANQDTIKQYLEALMKINGLKKNLKEIKGE